MLGRKALNSAELDNRKGLKSPRTVVTVNDEVQTKEEATVYIKVLDLFVTVKLLEHTPAVLSLGSLSSSSSATPTSPISVLQEAVVPTLHPASTRREDTSITERISPSHVNQQKQKKQIEMKTTRSFG